MHAFQQNINVSEQSSISVFLILDPTYMTIYMVSLKSQMISPLCATTLQGWNIHSLVASGNISDGVCDSTYN